jgi:hypothetical protein
MIAYTEYAEDCRLPPHDPTPGPGETIAAGGLVVLRFTLDPESAIEGSRHVDALPPEIAAERAARIEALAAKYARGERLFEPGRVPPIPPDRGAAARRLKRGKRR